MRDDEIRKAAYEKWEAEGKPEGQHERHWTEAENDLNAKRGVPTSSEDDGSGGSQTTSDAIPSRSSEPGGFKPGELASENK